MPWRCVPGSSSCSKGLSAQPVSQLCPPVIGHGDDGPMKTRMCLSAVAGFGVLSAGGIPGSADPTPPDGFWYFGLLIMFVDELLEHTCLCMPMCRCMEAELGRFACLIVQMLAPGHRCTWQVEPLALHGQQQVQPPVFADIPIGVESAQCHERRVSKDGGRGRGDGVQEQLFGGAVGDPADVVEPSAIACIVDDLQIRGRGDGVGGLTERLDGALQEIVRPEVVGIQEADQLAVGQLFGTEISLSGCVGRLDEQLGMDIGMVLEPLFDRLRGAVGRLAVDDDEPIRQSGLPGDTVHGLDDHFMAIEYRDDNAEGPVVHGLPFMPVIYESGNANAAR